MADDTMAEKPERITMKGGAVKTEIKVADDRAVKLVRGREIPPEGYGRTTLVFKCGEKITKVGLSDAALLGLHAVLNQWITDDGRVRDPDEMLAASKPVKEWVQHVLSPSDESG